MSDKGDTATLATRGLDLAARVVDLTSVLSQTSNLAGGLYELGQWLALERVDRTELYDCFAKARGLVYANAAGQGFYNDIANAKSNKNVWPLSVQQSGSLGRLIIKDPHLSWIVSTTACLYQFHNDRFISEVVCMLIMLSDPQNEGRPEYELRYLSGRVELKAVVDRIISSIWFNIVNSGTGTERLPEELDVVCAKGHNLNGDKLGVVVHALKKPRDKVVVESEHLLKNLTLWLLLHFPGRLTVSVSGKVLFEKILGESDRIIELKIKKFCGKEHDCSNEEDTYRLFSDIKGSYEEFLSGTYPSSFDMPETSRTRRTLYDVMNTYDIGASLLSEEVKTACRQTAQLMVEWLLSVPLTVPVDADFGFSAKNLDIDISEPTKEPFTIGSVLGRSPSILNLKYGRAIQKRVVFAPAQPGPTNQSVPERLEDDISEEDVRAPEFHEEDVLEWFPVLKDLVVLATADCQCHDCKLHQTTSFRLPNREFRVQSGCKGWVTLCFIILQISHAIADSFGAPDISGTRDPEPLMKAMLTLLAEILHRKQIRWDIWFSVAACVYLGCPFKDRVMDIELGGTAYAAIQYGNLAVVAPWLDLNKEQDVQNCFRFRTVQGNLGIMRESAGEMQFKGVPNRFAIIQAEHTEDTSNFNLRFEKWSEPLTGSIVVREDDSTFQSEVVLVSADEDVYRLLLRIRSDTFVRIIDPVDAMIRLARSLPYVECEHKENLRRIENPQDTIKLYNFDDLLGRWQNEETFYGVNKIGPATLFHGRKTEDDTPGLIFHLTSLLHHNGMINIARALAVNCMTIVNKGDCCLPCAIQKAKTMPMPEDNESLEVRDRYIINVITGSKQVSRRSKRSYNVAMETDMET